MDVKHRSLSLVTHLVLRLHQPEAKYRTPFALATPFADLKVSNIRRALLTGVLLLNPGELIESFRLGGARHDGDPGGVRTLRVGLAI